MSEWKSIESAPRDGTTVLVYDLSFGVCTGYWSPDCEDWIVCADCGECFGDDDVTHWMPFPAPPRENETARYPFMLPPSIAAHHDFQWALEMMAIAFTEAAEDVNTPDAVDPQEARADLDARALFLALADAAMQQAASPPAEG
jgi:hypothetical protein